MAMGNNPIMMIDPDGGWYISAGFDVLTAATNAGVVLGWLGNQAWQNRHNPGPYKTTSASWYNTTYQYVGGGTRGNHFHQVVTDIYDATGHSDGRVTITRTTYTTKYETQWQTLVEPNEDGAGGAYGYEVRVGTTKINQVVMEYKDDKLISSKKGNEIPDELPAEVITDSEYFSNWQRVNGRKITPFDWNSIEPNQTPDDDAVKEMIVNNLPLPKTIAELKKEYEFVMQLKEGGELINKYFRNANSGRMKEINPGGIADDLMRRHLIHRHKFLGNRIGQNAKFIYIDFWGE